MLDTTDRLLGDTICRMADFPKWLRRELDDRDWNWSDLSRASGVSDGVLSHISTGTRQVGPEVATKIAKALHMPAQVVYEAAGLLPPAPDRNKAIEQIGHMVAQLPAEKQAEVLEYVRLQVRLAERKGRNAGPGRERVRAPG